MLNPCTQNLGMRRNIESVLGPDPLLWCWPTVPPGNGLKYPLADGEGKWIQCEMRKTWGEDGEHETYGVDGDYLPEP